MALLTLAGASPAAPVGLTGSGDEALAGSERSSLPAAQAASAGRGLATGRGQGPEVSTGNKNLDLLLEMQGRPGEAEPAARARLTPGAASILKGAGERERPVPAPAPTDSPGRGLLLEGQGVGVEANGSAHTTEPPARREWSNGSGAAAGDDSFGDRASRPDVLVEEPWALQKLRELVQFLRENRFLVLGGIGALALLSWLAKLYARRP